MNNQNEIIDYINSKISELSSYNINITSEQKEKVISKYITSNKDIYEIEKEINIMIKQYIENQKKKKEYEINISNLLNNSDSENKDLSTIELGSKESGIKISYDELNLLLITEINTYEELKEFINNSPQFPINKEKIYSELVGLDLEKSKRLLYEKYLNTLLDYKTNEKLDLISKAKIKLIKFGVDKDTETFNNVINLISENKMSDAYKALQEKYGNDFIVEFNRNINDDYEDVKSISYDEIKSLSSFIDREVQEIIIPCAKYDTIMKNYSNGKYFDPYYTDLAAKYAKKHGKNLRYNGIFDHEHINKSIEKYINLNGRTIDEINEEEIKLLHSHKEEILDEMKIFANVSIDNIISLNKQYDGVIDTVEIFNELIEKNKKNKDGKYSMVWEKYFGISISDILSTFPVDSNGFIIKPDGVSYMYNETTLTESSEKRKAVEKILFEIEESSPGLIDIFGDQMHLSDEDIMTNEGEKNIVETAKMLKRINEGNLIVDNQEKSIIPKKIESTEFDLHFKENFINLLKEKNINPYLIKEKMINKIQSIYSGIVDFNKTTYWNIFEKNDHNVVRENKKRIKQGNDTIDTMFAGLIPKGQLFKNEHKLKKKDANKKIKTHSNPEIGTINNGYSNIITISLIVIIIILFVVLYLYYKIVSK